MNIGPGPFTGTFDITKNVTLTPMSTTPVMEGVTVNTPVVTLGGDGGLIAVDRAGNVAMPFVSEGMYRGVARGGRFTVAIYR